MTDQIKIDNKTYDLIDQIDNVPIVDSFVKTNKIGRGNGEARLYLGPQNSDLINFDNFFGGFKDQAFFLKKDFDDYLDDARFEYEEKEQVYCQDITPYWQLYKDELVKLNDYEYFNIESALGDKDPARRYYIRSKDDIWEFFRKIMLPTISYVAILKIKDSESKTYFLFRPVLNYFYNKNYHPAKIREQEQKIENESIPEEKKKQLVAARDGQGGYRKKLLDEKAECFITKVNDERLLIASHIKPWSVSDDNEKVDHFNGLALTPTYDRMFDQGFISFTDEGTIMISPYISPLNIKKLNLTPNKVYEIVNLKERLKYLKYHRENIFKK